MDENGSFTPEFAAEIDRRIKAADADPSRGIPWEVVDAELIAREKEWEKERERPR